MARTLDFTDGFDSALEPSKGSISANALRVFVDDAAYVADKGGAAAKGDAYYNSTRDVATIHDGVGFVDQIDEDSTQALENKTMDDTNTVEAGVLDGDRSSTYTENLGLKSSVAANAATFAMATRDGAADPAVGSPVSVSYRSSTATLGAFNVRKATAALNLVVPSTATLGHLDGEDGDVNVYGIDNSGTELAVSKKRFPENDLVTTVALSAASDDGETMYSTIQRTDVPLRWLGTFKFNQVTAGLWALGAIKADLYYNTTPVVDNEIQLNTHNGFGAVNTKISRYSNVVRNTGDSMTLAQDANNGDSVTVNKPGVYAISMSKDSPSGTNKRICISLNSSELTSTANVLAVGDRLCLQTIIPTGGTDEVMNCSVTKFLKKDDVIRPHSDGGAPVNTNMCHFHMVRVA